ELVVTRNHLDIRGWQLVWTEDPSDTGTLTLTDDPVWSDLRAGTIITFIEMDTIGDGLDTDTSYDPNAGDWWININTLSFDGTPRTQYVTTVTNVAGDSPGAFSVGNANWQLTILDADSTAVFGPAGEGIPLTGAAVNSREVLKLEEDPSPTIDPVTSNYRDGTSSSFGHPNIWGGGDEQQGFACLRCDDGGFCNGPEACDASGVCQPGVEPCMDQAHCDEDAGRCLECIDAAECDDNDLCTQDLCNAGLCQFPELAGCRGGGGVTPTDEDDDGIVDALDRCPDTPDQEAVDEHGCACSQIDDDEDGIDNCTDECPDTSDDNTADELGCSCSQLDDDGDGVDDCADECPGTPVDNTADERGCNCDQLDSDEDGVTDCEDQCPETTSGETADADGCSCLQVDPIGDDDQDGVLNCLDGCTDTPADDVVDAAGCSCLQLDPQGDDDADGILNCLDACADTPATDVVDIAGCTIPGSAEEPPAESPVDGDERDDEEQGSPGTPTAHTLCGLFDPGSFAFLCASLLLVRFGRYPRRQPGF
ncbi:MAG: hypothetical protein JSU63_12285, partial [Phycisphaerales bacterium]